MECLEQRPPYNSQYRWFWISVLASRQGDPDSEKDLVETLEPLIKDIVRFFLQVFFKNNYYSCRNDRKPFEYLLFLLTLLEYDYACCLLAQDRKGSGKAAGIAKTETFGKRAAALNSMDDLCKILAFENFLKIKD